MRPAARPGCWLGEGHGSTADGAARSRVRRVRGPRGQRRAHGFVRPSPVECSAVCAGFALVCDYASTSPCHSVVSPHWWTFGTERASFNSCGPSGQRAAPFLKEFGGASTLCTALQHSKSTLTAPKQMGRSKFNKRHMKQAYAGNAFNHGRAIPTRDQRQTPPREAYFLVNLLYCVSFLVIGGALLSLRS